MKFKKVTWPKIIYERNILKYTFVVYLLYYPKILETFLTVYWFHCRHIEMWLNSSTFRYCHSLPLTDTDWLSGSKTRQSDVVLAWILPPTQVLVSQERTAEPGRHAAVFRWKAVLSTAVEICSMLYLNRWNTKSYVVVVVCFPVLALNCRTTF